jgi:glycosyltransferase
MKVSIITVVLNSAEYIEDCIKSVIGQDYKDIEYIIIDGGSIDGTIEIIRRYKNRIAKWISEPDRGIYDAMNKGIRMASGDVIGILNSDDMYANQHVLEKVAAVFADGQSESCYGDLIYVDAENADRIRRVWRSDPYNIHRFYQGWMPPHPTFFVHREVYEQYGGFNLELGTAADYELMLRFLVRHEITSSYIPKVLVCMRTGGMSNASVKNRIMANRMDRKAWAVNGLKPYPWTLLFKPLRKIPQFFLKPSKLPISALTCFR